MLYKKAFEYFKQLFDRPGRVANTTPSVPDKRDYVVKSVPSVQAESYTIPRRPPIRNQLQYGSCRSHTSVRSFEIQLLNSGYDFDGSELYHYYMARKEISKTFPKDTGMSMRQGCEVALKYGNLPEQFHRYNVGLNTTPHPNVHSWANLFKIKSYARVATTDDIKALLLRNIPVSIGMFMNTDFYSLRSSNWVWNPSLRGTKGGHAVLIVGFNKDGFIVDNSWGFWWGRQGQFLIPYDKMQAHTFDWFVELYTPEDKTL